MAEKQDKKSKKDKKENDIIVKNTIDLNPKIEEEVGHPAVFAFGRMNPPTIGHEKLVKKVQAVAKQKGGMPHIFLSQSYDSKKNPLPYKTKIKLAKRAFGNIVTESPAKTIIQVMQELERMGHKSVTLIAGSDRVNEFKALLTKYNGKDYTFDSIDVVSAGDRDPDAEGAEGMSASKMRAAVQSGDEKAFKSGLPSKLQRSASAVFNAVKDGMKIAEELEQEYGENFLDEALTLQQRRKRALAIRRVKARIIRGRKLAQRRMASKEKLQARSRRAAIRLIRRRVAGDKGKKYASLSSAEKIAIDKRVSQRKGAIEKIAKRLMPKVTKAERERLKSFMSSKNEENTSDVLNIIMEAYFKVDIEGLPPVFMTGNSSSTIKQELRKIIKKPDENVTSIEKVQRSDIVKAFRLQAQGKTAGDEPIGVDEQFEDFLEGKHHMLLDKKGSPKQDKRFRFNKKVEVSEQELFKLVDTIVESIHESAKIYDNIQEKAETSGISFDELFEKLIASDNVKDGYQSVNSFIANEGKRPGLWDNIHAKRKRIKAGSGERMRKPGEEGRPTAQNFKDASEGKEHSWKTTGHYTIDGKEWTGDQHAYNGVVMTGKTHSDASQRLYHYKDLPPKVRNKIEDDLKEGAAEDRTKLRIKQEKERDKVKHDRMMDRARLSDTRTKNRYVPEQVHNGENLNEAFTAMISDTMFANEFQELHVKAGFALHPSVDEANINLMLNKDKYIKAAKMVKDMAKKDPSHSLAYWAAEVIRANSLKLDARTLAKLAEEHGAGDEGTDKLVNKYKKDTPGQ